MKYLFLLIAVLLAATPAMAEDNSKESAYERVMRTNTLRCGYFIWPPYAEVDPNTGKLSGLEIDYANAVGKLLNLKVEFVQLSAVGMQAEELKKGIYDAYCLDSYYTFSSIKAQDYSTPFLYAPVFAYARENDTRFKTLDDLNKPDITFVGMDGDLSTDLVDRRFPNAKVQSLPATSDPSLMIVNIATQKADVAILDPGIVETYNANNPVKLKIISPDTPVAVYPISFSVAKGETGLLNMLNGAVSAMQNTSSTEMILKKYKLPEGSIYLPASPYQIPTPKKIEE